MRAIPYPVSFNQLTSVPVAIYTRVSTLGQVGGRFDSCESQAAICREYVQKHAAEGWVEAASYSDPAYSGGSMKRPGMEALMRHIATGGIKVVVIFKLERVLRSTDEWGPFRAFLKKHGCRLESPMENLVEVTAMDRFNNNLRVNLAEFERNNTADKVRAKMLAQAKQGIWNCGQVPFGYDYDHQTKTLHPNREEAMLVVRVYELAAQLISLTAIANALNDEGLRTRPRIFQRRDGTRQNIGGKRFRSDLLRKMLRNPIYLGRVRLHGEEFAAKHEPIVPRDLWERANAAVATALQPARCRQQTRDKHVHLLKGLVFCGHCGRAMIPNFCGKRPGRTSVYRYYTCSHVHKEKADATCPLRHVSAPALETAVIGFIGALGRRPETVQVILARNHQRGRADRGPLRARLTELDRQLDALGRKISNCAEAIAIGGAEVIGDELRAKAGAFKDGKQRLLVEREQIQQELLGCDQESLDAERIVRAFARFEEVLARLSPQERKEVVALCFERIEVRACPPTQAENEPANRQVELKVVLHSAQMAEGMEERIVVQTRARVLPPIARRSMTVETSVAFPPRLGSARILIPFQEEVGRPAQPRCATSNEANPRRHPIHQAVAWQRLLQSSSQSSQAALARKKNVSEPTMTRHLRLLRLAPEIQSQLLGLKTPGDLRRFSLNKMTKVAALPQDEQRRRVAAMQ